MTTEQYEFFKWSSVKSNDENKPDVLSLKLTQEIFPLEYSDCIKAIHEGKEKIFSLQYRDLKKLIEKALKDKVLFVGKDFKIATWLGISKFNKDRTPRRFRLET
jgi:hypothetical protein